MSRKIVSRESNNDTLEAERRYNNMERRFDNRNQGRNNNFNSRPREMHKATCSGCKKECEVPFKPTEGRDVFCRDCFKNSR